MRKRFFILLPFVVLITGALVWRLMLPSNVLYHGKPESQWIKSITYFGDEAQKK